MQTFDELIAALRVEIGLAPDDESQDAWLTARANSALAALRRYCRRWLWPASQFRDAFMRTDVYACNRCGGAVLTLAEIPIARLLSIVLDGTPQPVEEFEVLKTGRLFRKSGANLVPVIAFGAAQVDYVGGFDELPGDLYEVIAGVVKQAWSATDAARASASAGAMANVDKLTIFDVGSVEFGSADGAFYEGSVKPGAGGANPILGPWTAQLDYYRDYSRGIGLPVGRESQYVGAPPAPPP